MTADPPDPDAYLEWTPIRAVPQTFRVAVSDGQAVLGRYLESDAVDDLAQLLLIWGGIVDNPRFHRAPLPFRLDVVNRLGIVAQWQAAKTGSSESLAVSIERFNEALDLAPPTWQDRARYLYNLGSSLLHRYQRDGSREDLDTAVQKMLECVEAVKATRGPIVALASSGAARALSSRYRSLGDVDDLTRAVDFAEQSVRIEKVANSRRLGVYLYTLCQTLSFRFEALGNIEDLERAIALLEQSSDVELSKGGNSNQAMLGSLLRMRWVILHQAPDIDRAIELMDASLSASPDSSTPARLTNLGNALLGRYSATREREDLLRARDAHERAIELTGPADWQLASRHNNAGNSAFTLYETSNDPNLLWRTIDHYKRAVSLTKAGATELASREYNFGNALRTAFDMTGDESHAIQARKQYRQACTHGLAAGLQWGLAASLAWGAWADERRAWSESSEAYESGLEAIDLLFRRQVGREEKETWLRQVQGLPARAAFALAMVDRPREAAAAVERGRAFLLSEALESDRSSLRTLAQLGRSDLADQYRVASEAVQHASGVVATRVARDGLDAAIADVREVPGYENFLEFPDYTEVSHTADLRPIVYAVATPSGGAAILVAGSEVEPIVVYLENLTEGALRVRAQALHDAHAGRRLSPSLWEGTLDAVSAWLWRALTGPVLEMLGGASEVIVVPVGLLGLMPLHAAWTDSGDPGTRRRYALDAVVFSYSPNARALASARRVLAATSDPKVILAIDDPQPVSTGPVPGADVEVDAVRQRFGRSEVLSGTDATRAAVLARLSGCGVLHFACHGYATPEAPLDSALMLANDEPLSLRDLIELSASDGSALTARLAVLSACEASLPGSSLPDEVISLPTGLLQAGLAGVIGSQWAVDGCATAILMAYFYDRWRVGGLQPAAALRDAQCWLRDTTNGEKATWLALQAESSDAAGKPGLRRLWQAVVRRDPLELAHAHPRYWAAFTHVGV